LKDSELKEQALRNKAIMEGLISDDESCNDGWRKWEIHEITYHDHDEIEYENETHDKRQELCETHELPVCNMRRFEMIKHSFGQDEEYVVVKEDEYDDFARTRDDACRPYQEIFRMMDEGSLERPIRRIHQGRYGVSVPALTSPEKRPQRKEDQYGHLEEKPAPTTRETSAPPAPKTAKQLAAKRNQERVEDLMVTMQEQCNQTNESTSQANWWLQKVHIRDLFTDHASGDSGFSKSHNVPWKQSLNIQTMIFQWRLGYGSDPKGCKKTVKDLEDVADKERQHQMTEDEQVLHDELEKMIAQEVVAKALNDATRHAFEEEKRNTASQKREA
ncbi:hypothetical protein Tco_0571653, partial [Tanacetum coccineum]